MTVAPRPPVEEIRAAELDRIDRIHTSAVARVTAAQRVLELDPRDPAARRSLRDAASLAARATAARSRLLGLVPRQGAPGRLPG